MLCVVTIVCVLIGLAGILVPKAFSSDDGERADRQQVVAVATDFAVAYNTYDVAKVADYQKRVKGLLSTSYNKEFDAVTSQIFKALVDKKQVSSGAKVLGVAVDSIDKDSAVALVAVDASLTNTDNKAAVARHMRWRLNLVKAKGTWVINKLESVATAEASAGTPTASPTEGSAGK